MNRYFVELAYDGTGYAGWQTQPRDTTIQDVLEEKLSAQWREPINLTGCGRTDSGVHARGYFAHLNTEKELGPNHVFKINAFLPDDISVHRFVKVKPDAHARFDATQRRYRYHIHFNKSPFLGRYSLYIPGQRNYNLNKFQQLADLLGSYADFKPFCKAGSEVKHYGCRIDDVHWQIDRKKAQATLCIKANRFLHGMIRLIVGSTLHVAAGHMSVEDIKQSMDKQETIPKPYLAPAHGLILDKITYPYICSSPDYAAIFPACANG